MNKEEKLKLLEEIMDTDSGFLTGEELLSDLDSWDSMSVLGFMTEMRLRFDLIIQIDQIRAAETIDDVINLIPG